MRSTDQGVEPETADAPAPKLSVAILTCAVQKVPLLGAHARVVPNYSVQCEFILKCIGRHGGCGC